MVLFETLIHRKLIRGSARIHFTRGLIPSSTFPLPLLRGSTKFYGGICPLCPLRWCRLCNQYQFYYYKITLVNSQHVQKKSKDYFIARFFLTPIWEISDIQIQVRLSYGKSNKNALGAKKKIFNNGFLILRKMLSEYLIPNLCFLILYFLKAKNFTYYKLNIVPLENSLL